MPALTPEQARQQGWGRRLLRWLALPVLYWLSAAVIACDVPLSDPDP